MGMTLCLLLKLNLIPLVLMLSYKKIPILLIFYFKLNGQNQNVLDILYEKVHGETLLIFLRT